MQNPRRLPLPVFSSSFWPISFFFRWLPPPPWMLALIPRPDYRTPIKKNWPQGQRESGRNSVRQKKTGKKKGPIKKNDDENAIRRARWEATTTTTTTTTTATTATTTTATTDSAEGIRRRLSNFSWYPLGLRSGSNTKLRWRGHSAKASWTP